MMCTFAEGPHNSVALATVDLNVMNEPFGNDQYSYWIHDPAWIIFAHFLDVRVPDAQVPVIVRVATVALTAYAMSVLPF